MIDMASNQLTKVLSYSTIAGSSVLGFVQGFDSGMVAAGIGVVGLACTGLYFEYKRKKLEAWKLDQAARRENEKLEAEARIERARRELEAQIALDERRERAYATSLTHQLKQMQERVEDANAKLHELRNDAQSAKSEFLNDREDFRERMEHQEQLISRYEEENKRLLLMLGGKVEAAQTDILELKAAGSGDEIPVVEPDHG